MLRGEEYDVIGEASNGVAADLVGRLKPDVVCMDVVMPEKNGIEAPCEIKASQPTVEVIMVTSNLDPETVSGVDPERCLRLHHQAFSTARACSIRWKRSAPACARKKTCEIVSASHGSPQRRRPA